MQRAKQGFTGTRKKKKRLREQVDGKLNTLKGHHHPEAKGKGSKKNGEHIQTPGGDQMNIVAQKKAG